MRRKISKEKEALALIEEALTCRSYCINNPDWVERALTLLKGCTSQSLLTVTGRFFMEVTVKDWQVEIWEMPTRGFSYRRRKEGGDYLTCIDYYATAPEAVSAAKSEIQFGEA